jgi:hypothetical protein
MTEAEKRLREYLAKIGRRGGLASRRELTRSHAKQMVAIREVKRAALKAGKPWPPRDRRSTQAFLSLLLKHLSSTALGPP